MKKLAVALALLFMASPAMAQLKKPAVTGNVIEDIKADIGKPAAPALTGNVMNDVKTAVDGVGKGPAEADMKAIVKRIQDLGRADLNYAILKATAANTNGSKVRLQCLTAILAAKDAAEGTSLKDASGAVVPRPDPAIVTTMEDTAELVDALSPQGPLFTSCAGAAQLAKTNALAVVNAIVTGAAGLAALPAGL
jgi:hypothetical protein